MLKIDSSFWGSSYFGHWVEMTLVANSEFLISSVDIWTSGQINKFVIASTCVISYIYMQYLRFARTVSTPYLQFQNCRFESSREQTPMEIYQKKKRKIVMLACRFYSNYFAAIYIHVPLIKKEWYVLTWYGVKKNKKKKTF